MSTSIFKHIELTAMAFFLIFSTVNLDAAQHHHPNSHINTTTITNQSSYRCNVRCTYNTNIGNVLIVCPLETGYQCIISCCTECQHPETLQIQREITPLLETNEKQDEENQQERFCICSECHTE